MVRTWDSYCCHSGTNWHLPSEERYAAGSATRLSIVISENHSFLRNPVDAGCPPHHSMSIGTNVPKANVITKDDHNVRFLLLCEGERAEQQHDTKLKK